MRKKFYALFLSLAMASTVFASYVGAATIDDITDYDGDIINNPWADLYQPEEPTIPQPAGVNVALNKTATVSGCENDGYLQANALDGNVNTRWSSNYADDAWINVDLGDVYSIDKVVLNWEAAYGTNYYIQVSTNGSSWSTVSTLTNQDGGEDVVTFAAASARYVKIQGVKRALPYGYSLWELEVYTAGNEESDGDSEVTYGLISIGKATTASGEETSDTAAKNMVDGDMGTRWSSNFADNAWITVDLGRTYSVDKVVLNWEAAYGESYSIQVSTDGNTWTTVKTLTGQNGGEDIVTFNATNARYVKMQGIKRALPYGYSLWEMNIYGK